MPETSNDAWIQVVALTTAILAVLAASAWWLASSYSTKAQLAATQEASQWANYQSMDMKEHSFTLHRDILTSLRLLETKNSKAQKYLSGKIKDYDKQMARYAKEKQDLKTGAEDLRQQQEVYQRQNGSFGRSVMLWQFAILCTAVGGLIRKKIMWLLGLALGGWGIFYLVMGFLG